jgi:hypothetical protein
VFEPSFDTEDNNYFLSKKIALVNQIIGSDTIHAKRVSHYGLKSALLGQNDMPTITGRSKRDHPASILRKKVVPFFGGFTYKARGWSFYMI